MNDGGPAFPHNFLRECHDQTVETSLNYGEEFASRGMSLRDWFAGMAIGAWLF